MVSRLPGFTESDGVVVNRSTLWGMIWVLLAGGGEASEFEGVSVERLRQHVQVLAGEELRGRGDLSDRKKAADYLEGEYRKLGLKPLFSGGSYRQRIPAPALPGVESPMLGENVGAYLEGADGELQCEYVLVTAHFDHLGTTAGGRVYRGADDNAAGVGMVLEVARTLAGGGVKPRRSVAFVNFDLEENLLWGSRWFTEHPPICLEQIRLFITADLIGRNLMDLEWPGVFVMGGERGWEPVRGMLNRIPLGEGLEVLPLGADIVGTRSDYGPFRDHDVPFLFFSSGQHRDYHTPRDVPERVDFEKLRRVTMYIGECALRSAETNESAVWVKRPEPELEEVETLKRITEELEAGADAVGLDRRERLFVSRFHQRLESIREQGIYSRKERGEVVNSARQLLLMLFSR